MVEPAKIEPPRGRFAIILTHNRPDLLHDAYAAVEAQGAWPVVIDNASDPPLYILYSSCHTKIRVEDQPPNLSRLWNVGLATVTQLAHEWHLDLWDVAFLCDDAVIPHGWFDKVSGCMRAHEAMAASTHCAVPVAAPILKTEPDHDIWNRMCPWAFMIRGERAFAADEDLQWWWGDTHMDFTARKLGGMVIAPGPVVRNERTNEFTNTVPGLAEQAGRDGEVFAAKWGGRPW